MQGALFAHCSSFHFKPPPLLAKRLCFFTRRTVETRAMASKPRVIDSHLHVWASPEEAASQYPYFPGQEPSLNGSKDFLLRCMDDAGVDGALIVQPIYHMFDHSYVNSVLQRYPTKFVGCCLANPADDGSGIGELEHLVKKIGYRAVRFNPYLWPNAQKMTNEVGKSMFAKAGELGVPVGFMCFKESEGGIMKDNGGQCAMKLPDVGDKGKPSYKMVVIDHFVAECPATPMFNGEIICALLHRVGGICDGNRLDYGDTSENANPGGGNLGKPPLFGLKTLLLSLREDKGLLLHILDIEELCSQFSSTTVIIDHFGFCKPPMDGLENEAWSRLLGLSKFPQVYVKVSASFRVSRKPYPYDDISSLLSDLVTTFGAERLMWGSDFPYVVKECGYKAARDQIPYLLSKSLPLSNEALEWIMGKTAMHLFPGAWASSIDG